VPGMTSDVKMRRSLALKLRETSRSDRSTVLTPSTVGRMIEKNPPRNTMTAFISGPSPAQSTTSGTSATRGSALKKFIQGSKVYEMRRYQPIAIPSGTATMTAANDPTPSSRALILTSFQKRGTWTSRAPAATIAVGELKKYGSMTPAIEPSCQAAKKNTTP